MYTLYNPLNGDDHSATNTDRRSTNGAKSAPLVDWTKHGTLLTKCNDNGPMGNSPVVNPKKTMQIVSNVDHQPQF